MEAQRAPGVIAVLTGADIRTLTKPMPTRVPRERFPGPIDIWCLAVDETIYVGQPLAAVVARLRESGKTGVLPEFPSGRRGVRYRSPRSRGRQ